MCVLDAPSRLVFGICSRIDVAPQGEKSSRFDSTGSWSNPDRIDGCDSAGGAWRRARPARAASTHSPLRPRGRLPALLVRAGRTCRSTHERGAPAPRHPFAPCPRHRAAAVRATRPPGSGAGRCLCPEANLRAGSGASATSRARSASSTHAWATPPSRSRLLLLDLPARRSLATWRLALPPPNDFTIAPTPPADIDVDAWDRSLDTNRRRGSRPTLRSPTSAPRRTPRHAARAFH